MKSFAMLMAAVLLWTGGLLLPGAPADPLDRWLAAQTNLHSWAADFVQTRSLKALAQPLVATGKVSFAAPDRFRWELGAPPESIALRQSNLVHIIYPKQKRVEQYDLSRGRGAWGEVLSLLEAGFPRSRVELESRFRIAATATSDNLTQITLVPRPAPARRMMPELRVGFSPADGSLRFTEMTLADGSRLRQDFTNAVVNPAWQTDPFAWAVPPEFQIVEPLAKGRTPAP